MADILLMTFSNQLFWVKICLSGFNFHKFLPIDNKSMDKCKKDVTPLLITEVSSFLHCHIQILFSLGRSMVTNITYSNEDPGSLMHIP